MRRVCLSNSAVIVGIDEAGRGALAGPVVAGACELSNALSSPHPGVRICDSKKLSPEEREESFEWIIAHCVYGFGAANAGAVDRLGILGATEKAMHSALSMIGEKITPTYLLIDGRDKFWFDYPHSSVIRGDESEVCISAASIVAKVMRDRMMVKFAEEFPEYGFAVHKGYGVPEHFVAIERHGECPLHRRTFLTIHYRRVCQSRSPPQGQPCPLP